MRQCLIDLFSFLSLVSLRDTDARIHRQRMLREQRFIEALVELLTACFPSASHFELLERLKRLQKLEKQEEMRADQSDLTNEEAGQPASPTQPKQLSSRLT